MRKSEDAKIEEGEIINSSPAITQTEKTSSEVAIGSDATSQQAVIDANIPTTQQPAADAEQSSTEESAIAATTDWGTYKEPTEKTGSEVAIGSDATSQQAVVEVNIPIEKEPTDIQSRTDTLPNLDGTPTYIRIANLSSDTTQEDLIKIFGLHNTPYLQNNVGLTLFFHSKGQYKGYAIVRLPKHARDIIIQFDGKEYNNRQLNIMDITLDSLTTHELRLMSQGSNSSTTSSISGRNKHTGDLRPAPNASSRQVESVSTVNRTDDEFEGSLLEKAGGDK